MNELTITTICGDPGGANAILPVISLLQQEGKVKVKSYVYGPAVGLFARFNLPFVQLSEQFDIDFIRQHFSAKKNNFLFTATSQQIINWEKFFIAIANEMSIASLSLLDYWSHYRMRFSDENKQLIYMPSYIAVMDKRAKREMIAEGIPSSKITITGQPAFDALMSERKQFTPEKKETIRSDLGVEPNAFLVLFASQPYQRLYGSLHEHDWGYDEHVVLTELVQSLEKLSQQYHQLIHLLICPHPKEELSDYECYLKAEHITVSLEKKGNNREHAMAADLVTGMTTILLLEATYLNCVVLSLQPGLKRVDPLPSNAAGTSVVIKELSGILPLVETYLFNEKERTALLKAQKKIDSSFQAARCVADYIYEKIGNH